MGTIVNFPRRKKGPEDPRLHILRRFGVMVAACKCGSTLCELHTNMTVVCARCHYPAENVRWRFIDPPPRE